jgi:hypothetical protein
MRSGVNREKSLEVTNSFIEMRAPLMEISFQHNLGCYSRIEFGQASSPSRLKATRS